ncbi:MAG: hypothetical protein ACP5R0_03700 [Thermoplasmata archaeon]
MKIKEGLVELEVKYISKGKGPGKKSVGYYSEAMVISRDLTVTILKNYFNKKFKALDLLGGSGIRGLRIEKECNANVTINDNNPKAIEIIEYNKKLNDSNAEITRFNASKCIPDAFYEYIDIDPYGSPVPFIDPAIKAIKNHGIIGITATDLPNLTGTNVKKGMSLYHSSIIRNDFKHESGLRALIAFFVKRSAEYEFSAIPLISYFGGYYYRIFFKMEKGIKKLEKNLEYVQLINTLSINKVLGPIWIGNIHDIDFLEKMEIPDYIKNFNKIKDLKGIWVNENPLFFYSLENISKLFGTNIPKVKDVINALIESGFRASKTQFNPIGIKTNASLFALRKIFNERFIK